MEVPFVDWSQPSFADMPGDLGSALIESKLTAIESDRAARKVRLCFDLPPEAGTPEATFVAEAATHLLSFVYLPPHEPLHEGLSPEEAMASVGDWARRGLVVSADPLSFGTPLVIQRAFLHATDAGMTFTVEGYGEDAERLVWWEVRVAGATIQAG